MRRREKGLCRKGSQPLRDYTSKSGGSTYALPQNQTFLGFGRLHLTPALFVSQSCPSLGFGFAALSVVCTLSFRALVAPESWAGAGTTKAKASKAMHANLFMDSSLPWNGLLGSDGRHSSRRRREAFGLPNRMHFSPPEWC